MEFNSKILVFGEYGIIHNSQALAIPYPMFSGHLAFNKENLPFNNELWSFAVYLQEIFKQAAKPPFIFNLNNFFFDLEQGLHFSSSIPQGFGVGSSGALCAALYHRYGDLKKEQSDSDIQSLRLIFSIMESHFHGKSSGLDPLISFLNSPLIIGPDKSIKKTFFPSTEHESWGLFLLNTGRPRRTEPLVNHYLEKSKLESFSNAIKNQLIPINNLCMENFLSGNINSLFDNFKSLSEFQLNHFEAMVPPLFRDYWSKGIESGDYYLKLCGAGGGGFLLGLAKDFNKCTKLFGPYHIRRVP